MNNAHDELRAHIDQWRKGAGFNSNPFAELNEKIRWLCVRLDELRRPITVCTESTTTGGELVLSIDGVPVAAIDITGKEGAEQLTRLAQDAINRAVRRTRPGLTEG